VHNFFADNHRSRFSFYVSVTRQRELKYGSCGSLALAHKRPPCASMIERQIDKPTPKPPGFVV
jgi:hypothetical protein